MPTKRKRLISNNTDSDDEEDFLKTVSLAVTTLTSKSIIPEVKTLSERLSNVPQATVTAMRPKLDDISDAIASHHSETQYVHQKHGDQARMLVVLNKRVDALQAEITRLGAEKDHLNAEKDTLHRDVRMIQGTALADSTQLFEKIKRDVKKMKGDIEDLKAGQTEILKTLQGMQELLKTLKNN
jgi:chromosome segregation ATPase